MTYSLASFGRGRGSVVACAFALVVVALVIPLALVEVPPLGDYPNHLARILILSNIDSDPYYGKFFQISLHPVPDLAFDSDPFTGVWIYDSFPVYGTQYYDWTVIGGTSVASPALAGIVNKAGAFAASSQAELATIYANAATANFRDLKSGFCGFYMGYSGTTGWDFCTGVGVVNGYKGK